MCKINSIQSTINYIKKELETIYTLRECESIAFILIEYVLNYSKTQVQLNKTEKINQDQYNQILEYLSELKMNKPIQYVLGEAYFYDLVFNVNPFTLIPRPETEELVHAIISENTEHELSILDIGTGSGCIPICLAKFLKSAEVDSVDISNKAIETAKKNAELNQEQVNFYNRDFLQWENFEWKKYDIIVSNPPYVTEAEKEKMEKNVLNFEPHTALFVSNEDPLIFYRKIAEFAIIYLKEKGRLYFEINENLGNSMIELLLNKGFLDVQLRKDINGKDRILSAIKPA
jgi:release factor glutamine methyltransferase